MEIQTKERLLETLRLSVPTMKCLLQLNGCYGPISSEHVQDASEMEGAELAVFVTHVTNLAEPFAGECVRAAIEAVRKTILLYLETADINAKEYLATCEAYAGYVGNERRL